MKKSLVLFLWFPICCIFFFCLIVILLQLQLTNKIISSPNSSLPNQADILGSYYSDVIKDDARSLIITRFLTKYQCPLIPFETFSDVFVKVADEYHLDFRLLPAIAMQESGCCKKIPENSFNCWGYGIYGNKVTRFSGFQEGIETVGKSLSLRYADKGLNEVDEIMRKYTPQSNGSWATGVLTFMYEMK